MVALPLPPRSADEAFGLVQSTDNKAQINANESNKEQLMRASSAVFLMKSGGVLMMESNETAEEMNGRRVLCKAHNQEWWLELTLR